MEKKSIPLLTYMCSISPQKVDENGNVETFSVTAGKTGRFAENVLKHMPISETAGKYLMEFNPTLEQIIIRKPK